MQVRVSEVLEEQRRTRAGAVVGRLTAGGRDLECRDDCGLVGLALRDRVGPLQLLARRAAAEVVVTIGDVSEHLAQGAHCRGGPVRILVGRDHLGRLEQPSADFCKALLRGGRGVHAARRRLRGAAGILCEEEPADPRVDREPADRSLVHHPAIEHGAVRAGAVLHIHFELQRPVRRIERTSGDRSVLVVATRTGRARYPVSVELKRQDQVEAVTAAIGDHGAFPRARER